MTSAKTSVNKPESSSPRRLLISENSATRYSALKTTSCFSVNMGFMSAGHLLFSAESMSPLAVLLDPLRPFLPFPLAPSASFSGDRRAPNSCLMYAKTPPSRRRRTCSQFAHSVRLRLAMWPQWLAPYYTSNLPALWRFGCGSSAVRGFGVDTGFYVPQGLGVVDRTGCCFATCSPSTFRTWPFTSHTSI